MPSPELVATVDAYLAKKDDRKLKSLLTRTDDALIAQVIDHLSNGKRKTFAILPPEIQAEVVWQLSEQSKAFIIPRLSDHTIARFLHFCYEDDAVDCVQFVSPERQEKILAFLKQDKRGKIEKLLHFDPETAGGLMDLNFLLVKPETTLKDILESVRKYIGVHKQAPLIVVADEQGKTEGFLSYKLLLLSPSSKIVRTVAQPLPLIPHTTDQEHVVKFAMREKSEAVGVVDDQNHFLGIIQLQDLLKISQLEATEDVYKFAGVSPDEEMLSPASTAIRMRYRWLIINLGTAFLAASVVTLFQGTIAKMAILAAYMPIVAGMGGNAGTQTLAVVVRGLALGEMTNKTRNRVIRKEVIAGFANGLINGVIVFVVVSVWPGGSPMIGLVLGLSMVINLVVAGFFGSIIPILLKTFKIDPAIASSVFVTTATDIFGFFSFLGLATLALEFVPNA